jgi:hypothetical protein
MFFLLDIKTSYKEKKMTKEDLIESMELIVKANDPKKAAELIWVLWMDHNNYMILKDKVVHKDTEKEISL